MNLNSIFGIKKHEKKSLANGEPKSKPFLPYELKSVSRIRQDIKSWNRALDMNRNAEEPRTYALQLLFDEIKLDALLTSQIENRKRQVFSCGFNLLNAKGDIDEAQTEILKKMPAYRQYTNAILDSLMHGYSLTESTLVNGQLQVSVIPRTNVIPQKGIFVKDYTDDITRTYYRDMREYGTWILEFDNQDEGLLNKAVPHTLFKRFAQSCWSELCEIYGIPPRVMKTNTQDSVMLRRAEQMMKDMGAAAYFIIDETENFEWAKAADTNGDVYKNLINLCSNEISLLISGAIIGQDTVNGNRSKDEASQEMLWQLIQGDMQLVQEYWNTIIIPAMQKMGILKGDIRFKFEPSEDIEQLFRFTTGLLPFKEIDNEWIKDKFGVEVTGDKQQPNLIADDRLKADYSFFD